MILVTGATGRTGGAAARTLRRSDAPVRALVRDRRKAAGLERAGVELVEGDLAKPETLARARAGAEKVLLVAAASPDTPRIERNLVDAAAKAREHASAFR